MPGTNIRLLTSLVAKLIFVPGTKSEARKVNKKVIFCSLQNFFLVIYFAELVTAN